MAIGINGVVDAVGAVDFHDSDVHGLPDVFVGAEYQTSFQRNVGDDLVDAFGSSIGFQAVQPVIVGS